MTPYLTSLFLVVSSLLVDAVESGEVEIGADEHESVYDVQRPMGISSDENNEDLSLLRNVYEGEVDPRPEFPFVEEIVNYEDLPSVVGVVVDGSDVVATAATACVVVANANADVDDACSDVDALPNAFDDVAYVVDDDADANASMLNVARHLDGAYANAGCQSTQCGEAQNILLKRHQRKNSSLHKLLKEVLLKEKWEHARTGIADARTTMNPYQAANFAMAVIPQVYEEARCKLTYYGMNRMLRQVQDSAKYDIAHCSIEDPSSTLPACTSLQLQPR